MSASPPPTEEARAQATMTEAEAASTLRANADVLEMQLEVAETMAAVEKLPRKKT